MFRDHGLVLDHGTLPQVLETVARLMQDQAGRLPAPAPSRPGPPWTGPCKVIRCGSCGASRARFRRYGIASPVIAVSSRCLRHDRGVLCVVTAETSRSTECLPFYVRKALRATTTLRARAGKTPCCDNSPLHESSERPPGQQRFSVIKLTTMITETSSARPGRSGTPPAPPIPSASNFAASLNLHESRVRVARVARGCGRGGSGAGAGARGARAGRGARGAGARGRGGRGAAGGWSGVLGRSLRVGGEG